MKNRKMLAVGLVALVAAALVVTSAMGGRKSKKKKSSSPAETSSSLAGSVGDWQVSLAEVDRASMAANPQPYQQLYDARKATLNRMVETHLIEQEAAARGISAEELLQAEVGDKIKPIASEEVQAFYDANKARMGGRTLEQVQGQIQEMLSSQLETGVRQRFLDSLRSGVDVRIALDPPRVEITGNEDEPSMGPNDAAITIVAFSEFQCPYCARVRPTLDKIVEEFGDQVKIVFRDYPLPFHADAEPAAMAAQCAHDQGKFWDYHDKLFENQRALKADNLKQYAADLGLDAAAFETCLESPRKRELVNEDLEYGKTLGVNGTPAFFVNGRFLNGAQPYEKFAEIIKEELDLAANR